MVESLHVLQKKVVQKEANLAKWLARAYFLLYPFSLTPFSFFGDTKMPHKLSVQSANHVA